MKTRKHRLQQKIAKYESLRAKLREAYPDWRKGNPMYTKRVENIAYRIKIWKRQLRYIQRGMDQLKQLSAATEEFFDVKTIRGWGMELKIKKGGLTDAQKELHIARAFFCKMAHQTVSLNSRIVSEFMGATINRDWAHRIRVRMTNKMRSDESLSKRWAEYKNYVRKREVVLQQIAEKAA